MIMEHTRRREIRKITWKERRNIPNWRKSSDDKLSDDEIPKMSQFSNSIDQIAETYQLGNDCENNSDIEQKQLKLIKNILS